MDVRFCSKQMESRRSLSSSVNSELNESNVQEHRSRSNRVSSAYIVQSHLKAQIVVVLDVLKRLTRSLCYEASPTNPAAFLCKLAGHTLTTASAHQRCHDGGYKQTGVTKYEEYKIHNAGKYKTVSAAKPRKESQQILSV